MARCSKDDIAQGSSGRKREDRLRVRRVFAKPLKRERERERERERDVAGTESTSISRER